MKDRIISHREITTLISSRVALSRVNLSIAVITSNVYFHLLLYKYSF